MGVPLLYTSTTPELALLETLVHLNGTPIRDLPPFVLLTIELPASVEVVEEDGLPVDWDQIRFPNTLPFFLVPRFTPTYPTLAFSVPSIILRNSPSRNILINPVHPLMDQVKVLTVSAHEFDERLQK